MAGITSKGKNVIRLIHGTQQKQTEINSSCMCTIAGICSIKNFLDEHPEVELEANVFAGATADGKTIEYHSEVTIHDIQTLARALDNLVIKVQEIYDDLLNKSRITTR